MSIETKLPTYLTSVPILGAFMETENVSYLKAKLSNNNGDPISVTNRIIEVASEAIAVQKFSRVRKVLTSVGALALLPIPIGAPIAVWQIHGAIHKTDKIQKLQEIQDSFVVPIKEEEESDEEWVDVGPEWVEVESDRVIPLKVL